MSTRFRFAAVSTTCCASAIVGANGFSSKTCFPALRAFNAAGTCAGRLAVMSTASASTVSRADSSVGKHCSGDMLRSCCTCTSASASTSTQATKSTSSLRGMTWVAQFRPQPPIPTCTRRSVISISLQPHTLGDGGFKDVGHQDDLPRHSLPKQMGQQYRRTTCDDHAYTRFHTSHACSCAGDTKIAGQSQLEAPAHGIAIHCGNGWLLTQQQQASEPLQIQNQRQEFFGGLVFGFLQVIPCTEVAPRARKDNDRNFWIALGTLHSLAKFRNHPPAHGIHRSWPVHHHTGNFIGDGRENKWFAAHSGSSSSC